MSAQPPSFPGDLLSLAALGPDGLAAILALAVRAKVSPGDFRGALAGGKVGLIFDKPSTRTRVSLEAAVWTLGMLPVALRPDELQLGRGETVADTARTLSRYLDAVTIRTFAQSRVEELAAYATSPIINALTDDHHPLQALADLLTLQEEFGRLAGLKVAYVGDGANNVAHSLAEAATLAGFHLDISAPKGYWLSDADRLALLRLGEGVDRPGRVTFSYDPRATVHAADAVYADVWTSMGQEAEREARQALFLPYQVNEELMSLAASHAIFLHCLPAHRGEEVVDAVIDGPASRVWDQAENRLHTSVAVLYTLITRDMAGARLPRDGQTQQDWVPVPGKLPLQRGQDRRP